MVSIERVRAAADRARPHVLRSPLVPVEGALLKLECLQPTGSFKIRGFFAAALALAPEELRRGLVTLGPGNAARACEHAAATLGARSRTITSEADGWDPGSESFIHPYADEEVMAGYGGIGLELLEDVPDLRRVVVPVGGGGLVTGIASAIKGMRRDVEVVGVQSEGYPLWQRAIAAGGPLSIQPGTIASSTVAPFDARMLQRVRESVDRWLVVPEPRLKAAIPQVASTAKVVTEGAGALAYAALEQLEPGPTTVAIASGGNLDPALLAELLS